MGWVSKLRFFSLLNTWNAEWIFPCKHCYDYSIQMDLLNSTSLLQALLIWLASAVFSSWNALYRSSPSYPKPAHALDNYLKSCSTKILNRWTDRWVHRTKVFFLPLCSGHCGYSPQHTHPFYALQSMITSIGFGWDWAHPYFLEWGLCQRG